MKSVICFVTGNDKKWAEVRAILCTVPLSSHKMDLLEIQGSRQEIAMHKCIQAASVLDCPVITEDTSLGFSALKGLPGPYIKHFLSELGHDGLNQMLLGFPDKSAVAYCTVAFFDPGRMSAPVVFEGETMGKIVSPRGATDFGWDPIFQPTEPDLGLTYAEMPKDKKNSISHRFKAFSLLSDYLGCNGYRE